MESRETLKDACPYRMKWCHTDLGANVFDWAKFVGEERMFGTLEKSSGGLAADHFDGVMAHALISGGGF